MKVKMLVLVVAMMLVAAAAQAGLWDPAVLNASFEAPDTGGTWTQYVDDWFKQSWWGSFIEAGGGSGIPATPYGAQWGGVTGTEQMFQQIGTVEDNLDVPISALLGHRANNTVGDLTVAIWVGGDVTVLNDYDPDLSIYYSLGDVGATQVDSFTVADLWGVSPDPLTATIGETLNTGTSGTVGTPLWISFETTGKAYLDNVVVPEPATMILLGLGGLCLRRRKR